MSIPYGRYNIIWKMPFRTVTDQKRHILIIGIGYGYIRMIFETDNIRYKLFPYRILYWITSSCPYCSSYVFQSHNGQIPYPNYNLYTCLWYKKGKLSETYSPDNPFPYHGTGKLSCNTGTCASRHADLTSINKTSELPAYHKRERQK